MNAAAAIVFPKRLTRAGNTEINDAGADPSNLPSILPSIQAPFR